MTLERLRSRGGRLPRTALLLALAVIGGLAVAGALLWSSSSSSDGEPVFTGVPAADPGPVHVHGLGVNPADGALFVATHTGLFRVPTSARKAVRVGDSYQDTMGFSVLGPDRFLGSGHPDARDRSLPPLLGLIESTDAGASWDPISLLGEADFHVLRSRGEHVYGYDASNDRLLRSTDAGRSWSELAGPEDGAAQVIDLAIDPAAPRRVVVTAVGGRGPGLDRSRDGGETWARLGIGAGLLAWPEPARLYLVDGSGQIAVSADGGANLTARGSIGGEPAAFLGRSADELYVALHDGTIKRTVDGGVTWDVRSAP